MFRVLVAISVCHLLNDMLQSVIPAVYPMLKDSLRLDFSQIGLITLTNQATASLLQPVVGVYTDRRPTPFSLAAGMAVSLAGLLSLAFASNFASVIAAVALFGIGSAVFHPESSRVARMASGGRHGLAQSLFQVGGNAGSSLGPLAAAFIVLPNGQRSIAWFSALAVLGILLLTSVGRWYGAHAKASPSRGAHGQREPLPRTKVLRALAVLLALIFPSTSISPACPVTTLST